MESDELQNIWKTIEDKISLKSIDELNQTLTEKAKKTVGKFRLIICFDIVICVLFIGFLLIMSLYRREDIVFQIHNSILCLITLFAFIVSLFSLAKLQNNKYNLSLKDWLGQRIILLSSWLLGKYSRLYIFIIPLFLVMINISIHVYFEYKLFIEVLKNEESIFGLLTGTIIGLFVSFFVISKIRKYHLNNLKFLKELYSQLNNSE